MQNFNFRDSEF